MDVAVAWGLHMPSTHRTEKSVIPNVGCEFTFSRPFHIASASSYGFCGVGIMSCGNSLKLL
jgi:hypothetical protein